MRKLKIIGAVIILIGVILILATNRPRNSDKLAAEQSCVPQSHLPLPPPAAPNAGTAKPKAPTHAPATPGIDDTSLRTLEELSADVLVSIRPVTWQKPTYSGATQLSEEDQQKVTRLAERYEENFQKIKKLTFHEETMTLPVGDSEWTRDNVMTPGGSLAESPTSLDITAAREPTFFHMKGQRQGRPLDLTVSAVGEMGTRTQGESWRVMYMDGDSPKFRGSYLLECGKAIHENVRCAMELPELGNLAQQYHLSDTLFTVVEASVTDWWESLGESHPNIPAKETVWFNNRTGMPQIVVREIVDEKERGELKQPYTEVRVIEYGEVDGVYYPKRTEWIGKGYQLRRTTKRTDLRLNGTAIE